MKARKNTLYTFDPCLKDLVLFPEHFSAKPGQLVRVIQLPYAPPPNTMGACHIEDAGTKEFLGMVSTDSLTIVQLR